MVVKTSLFWLKIMKCGINKIKFGMWLKIGFNFYSEPVYEYKYLKSKVREFDGMIKQTFWIIICQKKVFIILAVLL